MSEDFAIRLPPEALEALAQRVAEILAAGDRRPISTDSVENELLAVDEVAAILRAPRQRVYDLVYAGKLAKVKDGARVLIRRSDLAAYLDNSRTVGSRPAARMRRNR